MSITVIAEVGSNHCGSLKQAEELIDAAAAARCTHVKFQMFKWSDIRQLDAASKDPRLELDRAFIREAAGLAWKRGIKFLCTPFSIEAVRELDPLVDAWKISSAEAGMEALVTMAARTGKPMYVSMGYVDPEKIYAYEKWVNSQPGAGKFIPMHCVPAYPATPDSYALGDWLGHANIHLWGISDHTVGVGTSCAALALGARVFEKHIRLKEQPPNPDNGPHALTPREFKDYVAALWQADQAMGGVLRSAPDRPGRKIHVWRG